MIHHPSHPAMLRRDFLRTLGRSLGAGAIGASAIGAGALGALSALQPALLGAQPPRTAPRTATPRTTAPQAAAARTITVYKDPNCGCCKLWVDHMRAAGWTATVHDTADMTTVKRSMGVPTALDSCHTARVGTYTIEGHVPADLIDRLLREKPVAVGLAVPGMVSGSPGMEDGTKEKYDVVIFDKSGKSRVYASR